MPGNQLGEGVLVLPVEEAFQQGGVGRRGRGGTGGQVAEVVNQSGSAVNHATVLNLGAPL
jgi:hypothetical protein